MPNAKQKNPSLYESRKWGVLVNGPGTILAAHSFEEAVTKAAEINQMVVEHILPKANQFTPSLWAQAHLWSEIGSDDDHDPEETDWDEIC
jgi:hypothetical protein